MNDLEKTFGSFKSNNSIKQLLNNPLFNTSSSQVALFNTMNLYSQKLQQPNLYIGDNLTKALQPLLDLTADYQKQYKNPFGTFLQILGSNNNINFSGENTLQQFASNISSLSTDTKQIKIFDKYVSIPDSLIPDEFSYEEITEDSADSSNKVTKTAVPAKRLSFSNSLAILGILINILLFAITQMQSEKTLQSQIDELQKQTVYLIAIYKEIGSVSPELDLTPPDADSVLVSPASPSQCAGSYQPEEVN